MIEVTDILKQLAKQRPIFHSEADFQHALAWEIHHRLSDAKIRLEFPVFHQNNQRYLDILVKTKGLELLAIELKYKTGKLSIHSNDEDFQLKNQSAQDIGRYDFLKDVQRLEQFLAQSNGGIGYAIFLTNDYLYWKPPQNLKTIDREFRLHDERMIEGELNWKEASAGTMHTREKAIKLRGMYLMQWNNYSKVSPKKYGEFKYVIVKVQA